MLIAVTEDIQDAQRVVLWHGRHAEARLKVTDHFLRRRLNTLEVLLPILFPVLLSGTNGELGTFARRVCIRGPYQAANKVIERRPDVEDALAQEDAEANRRDGILDVVDDPRLLSIRLQNEIPLDAFKEHASFGMEGIEVFARPEHLRVNALHPWEGVRK